ncbi:hypothetical protein TrVFT333_004228 [Trichoderma virens FT-333]|nr:hypothetical protein TrVFT333_004228 [Trichoderma virens FT-333]
MSFLGSQTWMEIPFLHRGKTEFDRVIDTLLLEDHKMSKGEPLGLKTSDLWQISDRDFGHERGAGFKFACPGENADFERIVRILVELRELVSACASYPSPKRQESLSAAILADCKHLMSQPSLPFNVGLQVTSAASLVAQYASDSQQKQEAERLFTDWHGRGGSLEGMKLWQLHAKWEAGSATMAGVFLALNLPRRQAMVFANASPSDSAAGAPGNLQDPFEAQQTTNSTCRGSKTDERGDGEREGL